MLSDQKLLTKKSLFFPSEEREISFYMVDKIEFLIAFNNWNFYLWFYTFHYARSYTTSYQGFLYSK